MSLSPVSVAIAGPIVANKLNKNWAMDRREVIEVLNRIRLLQYTMYEKFKLFDDVFHCICVTNFNGYRGFTLPNDVLGVEAVYRYGIPLTLRSRWRESHTGFGCNRQSRCDAVLMAETFATERDINKITKVKIFTEHDDDNGKKAYLEVIDATNRQKKICFTLISQGFAVSPVKIKKILSVSLPTLVGSLLLAQDDGYELSYYAPWESVPNYRRMKISDGNCPTTVLVQGTKKFQKVYFDEDAVEVGNQLILEEGSAFFKMSENTSDAKELETAEYHLTKMGNYLKSEIARHRGNSIQDNTPFKGRRAVGKTLPGYR